MSLYSVLSLLTSCLLGWIFSKILLPRFTINFLPVFYSLRPFLHFRFYHEMQLCFWGHATPPPPREIEWQIPLFTPPSSLLEKEDTTNFWQLRMSKSVGIWETDNGNVKWERVSEWGMRGTHLICRVRRVEILVILFVYIFHLFLDHTKKLHPLHAKKSGRHLQQKCLGISLRTLSGDTKKPILLKDCTD